MHGDQIERKWMELMTLATPGAGLTGDGNEVSGAGQTG